MPQVLFVLLQVDAESSLLLLRKTFSLLYTISLSPLCDLKISSLDMPRLCVRAIAFASSSSSSSLAPTMLRCHAPMAPTVLVWSWTCQITCLSDSCSMKFARSNVKQYFRIFQNDSGFEPIHVPEYSQNSCATPTAKFCCLSSDAKLVLRGEPQLI